MLLERISSSPFPSKKIRIEQVIKRLKIFEYDKQAFSAESKHSQRLWSLRHFTLHLSVLLDILSFDTNKYNTTNNYKGVISMDDMITMSMRLPRQVVTWLRKSAALATIEQDKRVSMNSLIVEILARAMETDRRIVTRFVGSGKKIGAEKEGND